MTRTHAHSNVAVIAVMSLLSASCVGVSGSVLDRSALSADSSVIHGDAVVVPDHVVGPIADPGDTGLPTLPPLINVRAAQREDSVGIDFDPVDTAVDYRVYPLPNRADITVNGDGSTTIHNAVYRCAGMRQSYDLENNLNANDPNLDVFNPPWNWKAQVATNPIVGYVYVTPGAGRVPVYALAGYMAQVELGWSESRPKIYTTDATQRQSLINQNWRDDGVVFYVPAAASSATQTIYTAQSYDSNQQQHAIFYFGEADVATHMGSAPAFQVLVAASPSDATQPLMAIGYLSNQVHTELAVGNERYQRALHQGSGPLWHLEWAGITQPTTLVVEALTSGCPYHGLLAAQHVESPPHQTLMTLADLQTAAPTGEAFINGEYDNVTDAPIAIARSYVQVAPQPHDPADWDWYQGFTVGTDLGTDTMIDFMGSQTHFTCTWEGCRGENNVFDWSAYGLDSTDTTIPALFSHGLFLGQFWTAFDDTGHDVTGRLRFTARQMASVTADRFLHVSMSVNIVSTSRRFPQLIISDQLAPIDAGLANPNNNTLVIQTIGGPPIRLEAQAIHGLVNGHAWSVDNAAREHRFVDTFANYQISDAAFAALSTTAASPLEHAGMDRMTRFDVFVSSQRIYLFMDGEPAGCSLYPSAFGLSGPVTVTFGDIINHEGAEDEMVCSVARPYAFMHVHQCVETSRHFDDLGFKSGVLAPPWDEVRMPCGAY